MKNGSQNQPLLNNQAKTNEEKPIENGGDRLDEASKLNLAGIRGNVLDPLNNLEVTWRFHNFSLESQLIDHEPQWETLNENSRNESKPNKEGDPADEVEAELTDEVVSSLYGLAPFSFCSEVTLDKLECLPLLSICDEEINV